MKYKNNNLLILFILFISLYKINSTENQEIHPIISATLNGTAAFVSLENISPKEKYIYFSFDFQFHHLNIKRHKNIAYFLITSDFDLIDNKKEKIKYGFIDKYFDELNFDKDINTNISWHSVKILHKEKPDNDINYYIKIKRKKKNMKTLLLRIPVNRRNEGSITVENIIDLPSFNENEKNSDL